MTNPWKTAVFGGILVEETVIATVLPQVGIDTHSTIAIATAVAVVTCEVALRLFGRGGRGGGTSPQFLSPSPVTA
ncbi:MULTISPECIES: hypothetical protein [Pseudonocardia]|uniref:Uncharacterized protein n=1 Tax=Pseudonocardia xishanensis TaxID=630995 RepID=A0ABP8RZ86_9PSEU|nr:hypothetical protein [Pseudonocardia sp. WMMC193]MCF7547222.1 hypothetical protein [Pseudonocardia sp. WMMC193]